jgi:choloylglycine hydrolase
MCTNFKIKVEGRDGGIVAARSQEFAEDLKSKLFFRKVGHKYNQIPDSIAGDVKGPGPLHYRWTGKYAFVGMSVYDIRNANDGMNEKGLAVSAMWLPVTEYPQYDKDKGLSVDNFTDWVLSSFATCHEVKEALMPRHGKPEVVVNPSYIPGLDLPLHFPVHDAHGHSIVIEFIDGQVQITDNSKIGVLTNDPPFASNWHLENLKNYIGITPWDVMYSWTDNPHRPYPYQLDQASHDTHHPDKPYPKQIKQGSHGTGFAQLPGSPTSPDRYVRAAMMTNYAYPVKDLDHAVNLAWHILNTVDIPRGINRFHPFKKDGKTVDETRTLSDIPQWSVVADLKRKIYSVRMYDSPLVYSVDLKKLDLDKLDGKLCPIPRDQGSIDLTDRIPRHSV